MDSLETDWISGFLEEVIKENFIKIKIQSVNPYTR